MDNEALPNATVDSEPEESKAEGKKIVRRVIARPATPTRLPELVKRQASVSYYQRMLKGRLFTLEVRLDDASGPDDQSATREGTVTVQPVVPGALVSPALADISSNPGSVVSFSVMPLCYGKLPNARVELRSRGKSLDSIATPTKVGRRRLAGFLLLLTLLLVGLLIWDRHVQPLEPYFLEVIPQPEPPPLRQGPTGDAAGRGAGGDVQPPAATTEPPQADQPTTPRPRGGGGRPGGGGGGPSMPSLPPPPDLSKIAEPKWLPYRGENAIDRWLERESAVGKRKMETDSNELSDLVVVGLNSINQWKFGGNLANDGKDRSVFVWTYNGWEVLRNFSMAEVYVAAILITLTVIAWILTGPSRSRRRGNVVELSIP
jgi:hypothetical protein